MRPEFEAVNTPANSSFTVRRFREKRFSAPYHYHPEFELTLIVKGTGKRYVDTNMQDYGPGDFVLLAPDLPHCWKTSAGNGGYSVSIVIHFRKDFLGPQFFDLPEMKPVAQLLDEGRKGLCFSGDPVTANDKMEQLLGEPDPQERLLLLLRLLRYLTTTPRLPVLPEQASFEQLSSQDQERIHRVLAYIVERFQQGISLDAAAAVAHMSSSAFCKYFKRVTRKTFIEMVNDYKIDYAARTLVSTGKSIAQVCFESGFNDLSNFHKTFRARLKVSPLQYRNSFGKKLLED